RQLLVGKGRDRRFERVDSLDRLAEALQHALVAATEYPGEEVLNHWVLGAPGRAEDGGGRHTGKINRSSLAREFRRAACPRSGLGHRFGFLSRWKHETPSNGCWKRPSLEHTLEHK